MIIRKPTVVFPDELTASKPDWLTRRIKTGTLPAPHPDMAEKSVYSAALEETVRTIAAGLKPMGFKKNGKTLNRRLENGLVHVINFQSGQYPIGKQTGGDGKPAPSLYGKFCINLGVFVPEIHKADGLVLKGSTVHEYNCSIRTRLSELTSNKNQWYPIVDERGQQEQRLADQLNALGLAFFRQFDSREGILAYFGKFHTLPFHTKVRAELDVAIIECTLGDSSAARKRLDTLLQKDSVKGHPFGTYVEKVRRDLSL
jgi:hypothetical protein